MKIFAIFMLFFCSQGSSLITIFHFEKHILVFCTSFLLYIFCIPMFSLWSYFVNLGSDCFYLLFVSVFFFIDAKFPLFVLKTRLYPVSDASFILFVLKSFMFLQHFFVFVLKRHISLWKSIADNCCFCIVNCIDQFKFNKMNNFLVLSILKVKNNLFFAWMCNILN